MQSETLQVKELFHGSDVVRRFRYKMVRSGDKCTLLQPEIRVYTVHDGRCTLAVHENHVLWQEYAASGEKCTLLTGKDCFVCRSPYRAA